MIQAIKKEWNIYAAFAIICAIIISCAILSKQGQNRHSSQNTAAQTKPANPLPRPVIVEPKSAAPEGHQKTNASQKAETGKQSELDLNRRGVEAAEEAARWAKYGVYVGAAGGIFIILTLGISVWQGTISRQAYIASYRPRLTFRTAKNSTFKAERSIVVEVEFANLGETPAYLFRGAFDCCLMEGEIVRTNPNFTTELLAKQRIDPGQMTTIKWTCDFVLSQRDGDGIVNGEVALLLAGTVLYKDGNGTVRVICITRELNLVTGTYLKVPEGQQANDYAN